MLSFEDFKELRKTTKNTLSSSSRIAAEGYKTAHLSSLSRKTDATTTSRYLYMTANAEARKCDGVMSSIKNDGNNNEQQSTIEKLRNKEDWIAETRKLNIDNNNVNDGDIDDGGNPYGSRRIRFEAATRMAQLVDSEGE